MEKRTEASATDKTNMPLDQVVRSDEQNSRYKDQEQRSKYEDSRDKESKPSRVFVGNLSFKTSWRYLKDYMRKAGDVLHVDIFTDGMGKSKGCGLVEFATEEDAKRAIEELNKSTLDGREIFVRQDDSNQAKFDKDKFQQTKGRQQPRGGNYSPRSNSPLPEKQRPRYGADQGQGSYRRTDERRYEERRPEGRRYEERRPEERRTEERKPEERRPEERRPEERRPEERRTEEKRANQVRQDEGVERPGYDSRTSGWQVIVKNLPWNVTWQKLKDAFREFGNVIRADVPTDKQGRSAGYGFVIFEKEADAEYAIKNMDGADFNGREIAVKFSSGK